LAKAERVQLRIKIGKGTYSLLQELAKDSALDEGLAIQTAIERGMERYWSHWFAITAAEYERLKKRYRECQKDNELLRGLLNQNAELKQMVKSAGGPA